MRIAMIGTRYVGLVSVDKDDTKISALNSGEIPIYEPGLKDIVQSNVRQGRLQFTTGPRSHEDKRDLYQTVPRRRG